MKPLTVMVLIRRRESDGLWVMSRYEGTKCTDRFVISEPPTVEQIEELKRDPKNFGNA